jgi:hypothetical protein
MSAGFKRIRAFVERFLNLLAGEPVIIQENVRKRDYGQCHCEAQPKNLVFVTP